MATPTLYQRLVLVWSLVAVAPLIGLAQRSLTPGTVSLTVGYLLGWGVLWAHRRRTDQPPSVESLWGRVSFRLSVIVTLIACQVIVLLASAVAFAITVVAVAVVGMWLYLRSRDVEQIAHRLGRILLVVGSSAVVLVLGELICRSGPVREVLGGSVSSRRQQAALSYDGLWRSNRYGLRSFHLDTGGPPGATRIVALGDSFTWGDQIPLTESTWPYVVERRLKASGVPAAVFNLGETAYTTVNEAERLDLLGWRFEPAVVILQFTLNDPLPSGPGGRAVAGNWWLRTWPLPPEMELVQLNSALYAALDDRFRRVQIQLRYPRGYAGLYDDDFEPWHQCKDALGRMAQQCQDRAVPFYVVLFPLFEGDLGETYRYLAVHSLVQQEAERRGARFLDLRGAFAAADPTAHHWWAEPYDSHPGPQAHALAGEVIAEELLSTLPADLTAGSSQYPGG